MIKEWNDCIRQGWDNKSEIRERMDDIYKVETNREVRELNYAKETAELLSRKEIWYSENPIIGLL